MIPQLFISSVIQPRAKSDLNLVDLATKWECDKSDVQNSFSWHKEYYTCICNGFAKHYDKVFKSFRDEEFRMLEIGCADHKGTFSSTNMYLDYFPNAEIWGMDNLASGTQEALDKLKPALLEMGQKGWNFIFGDQGDRTCLYEVISQLAEKQKNTFKLIIDDGSHLTDDICTSLEMLWPLVEDKGYYIIEDICSSWPYPADPLLRRDNSDVFMAFILNFMGIKKLVDGVLPSILPLECTNKLWAIRKPTTARLNAILGMITDSSSIIAATLGDDYASWAIIISKGGG